MNIAAVARLDGEAGEERQLAFLKQHGVNHVILSGKSRGSLTNRFPPEVGTEPGTHWELDDLRRLRQRCDDAGLVPAAMENPIPPWCYDRVMLGLPGRDVQLDNLAQTIRNMGRAGITTLGYHWMVNPPGIARASHRTEMSLPGRGGAQVAGFDLAQARALPLFRERAYSEAEMWDNYAYFVKAIVPVAEQAGVRLALHPDDPPVESLGGMPRLFRSPAAFDRAMALAGSPASGLNLCLANWWAMGTDVLEAIAHFGRRGQIFYGHVQGIQGTVPTFRECFMDESDCDYLTALCALRDAGFDGVLLPGHYPHTAADDSGPFAGEGFAIGYLHGLLRAVRGGHRIAAEGGVVAERGLPERKGS
jgi:mannonate dehydratase